MSRSSTNKVKRCPNTMTTNCIEWLGEDIPCLSVCYGDTLTDVENAIALKLCELVGDVDMSKVTIPDCLLTAWNNLNEDKTIFYLFDFILKSLCTQQAEITSLQTSTFTKTSVFELSYQCCIGGCITTATYTIPKHLQNILDCLCIQAGRITTLETLVSELPTQADITSLQNQINDLKTIITTMKIQIQSATDFPIILT